MSEQAIAKADDDKPEHIKVLTFNIALDGTVGGLPGIIDLIRKSDADVVGLQESEQNTQKIADALGYNVVHTGDTAIMTRLPIDEITPDKSGIVTHTPGGKQFAFFDEHLYFAPYQPYQLIGIPYQNGKFIKTEAEAIDEAKKARWTNVEAAMTEIKSLKDQNLPTVVVGDFNEPSHLDWTDAVVKAGKAPIKVEWPSTKAFEDAGFSDSYRTVHKDPLAYPGYTWTPTTKADDPKDRHERIDFILYRGRTIKPDASQIIGEDTKNADIAVSPFPSDHRAVITTFEISKASK